MKCILCTIVILVCSSFAQFPQEKNRLIQLSYGIGDTLDIIDRDIFDLYPDIDGYKYALLFERDEKHLVSKIVYLNNEMLNDTVLIEDISRLNELRYNLNRFKNENDIKLESPLDASIFLNSGNLYKGKLQMFSKKHLFLNSESSHSTDNSSHLNYKTPISKVDSLTIYQEQNVGKYLVYGIAGGFALGFFAGYMQFDDDMGAPKEIKRVVTGAIGAGMGFLLGWLIGATLPPDIINVRLNSPYDVIKLKDYSAYYYQNNPTFEEQYVEIG